MVKSIMRPFNPRPAGSETDFLPQYQIQCAWYCFWIIMAMILMIVLSRVIPFKSPIGALIVFFIFFYYFNNETLLLFERHSFICPDTGKLVLVTGHLK